MRAKKEDSQVIQASNAASVQPTGFPDVGTLPESEMRESLDHPGVQNSGYLDKKGTPFGVSAMFNCLPPGTEIEDQEVADIREMPYHELVTASGYDGWKKA